VEWAPEVALAIASFIYAIGLAIRFLPLRHLRFWGWGLMKHALVTSAVISSLALVKYWASQFVDFPLTATYDDALAAAEGFSSVAHGWVLAISYAGIALGSTQAVISLALTPAMISGVGVLFASIASYLFSAIFGSLLFMQKCLSGILMFAEGLKTLLACCQVVAPALFAAGCILFAIPTTKRLGITFIVFGAALTLALPTAIVSALSQFSPKEAAEKIEETKEVQAYSIASKAVGDLHGGLRLKVLDRNGTIIKEDELGVITSEYHESNPLMYPYFRFVLESPPPLNLTDICGRLPEGVSCEEVEEQIVKALNASEAGFMDTNASYYDSYREGYRMTLTNGTYSPHIWIIGMWMRLHNQTFRPEVFKPPEDLGGANQSKSA